MKVSVVLTCYNSERTIGKTIESVLNQTLSDFEFIIWNDGSTDSTEKIIKSYDDPRIRYFYHENTGVGQAARMACEHVSAPYIARIDADDIAMTNRLQVEYDFMESHPDVVLVSSAVNFIDGDDKVLGRSFPYTNSKILKNKLSMGHNVFVHSASMFRTDVYKRSGGYLGIRCALDLMLFARISKYGKVVNLPDVLVSYRISTDSIGSSMESSGYWQVLNEFLKKMISEDVISEDEEAMYNALVTYAKRSKRIITSDETTKQRKRRARHILYKLYDVLMPVLGVTASARIIITMKNIAAHFHINRNCGH